MNEQSVIAPEYIDADFAFICIDDSMSGSRLFPGDVVFCRACDYVEDGKIAAVRIGSDFTLRRVYHIDKYVYLSPDNPAFPTVSFVIPDDDVEILGFAVKAICNVI